MNPVGLAPPELTIRGWSAVGGHNQLICRLACRASWSVGPLSASGGGHSAELERAGPCVKWKSSIVVREGIEGAPMCRSHLEVAVQRESVQHVGDLDESTSDASDAEPSRSTSPTWWPRRLRALPTDRQK